MLYQLKFKDEPLHQLSSHDLLQLTVDTKRHRPPSNTQKKPYKKEPAGISLEKSCRDFFKTWMAVYLLKYGLDILPSVSSGKIFTKPSVLRKSGGRDTAGFALFFSAYLTVYKTLLRVLRQRQPLGHENQRNAFVAGSVAGLTVLLDRNKDRRSSMALTLFVRAVQFGLASAMLNRSQRIHNKPLKTREREQEDDEKKKKEGSSNWEQKMFKLVPTLAPSLLLVLSAMTNIYALLIDPDCLTGSYYRFLNGIADLRGTIGPEWETMMGAFRTRLAVLEATAPSHPTREFIRLSVGTSSHEFVSTHFSKELAATVPKHIHHSYQLCALLHPKLSCTGNATTVAMRSMRRAIKMYAVFYGVMTLLWKREKALEKPKETAYGFVKSTLRSAAMLSLHTLLCCNAMCLTRRIIGREHRWNYLLNGILGSLAMWIEVPRRRNELILYMAQRALETSWRLFSKRGLVRRIPQWDTALLSLSMGVVMSVYQSKPEAISNMYRGALDRACGRS
ncbi:hypothetical protein BGZ59_000818 [Podila verticillata]|nr:hypothetical protein BGZ59_000818 [Podila verticillata]